MSVPTALEMVYFYASQLGSEEANLSKALFELDRAFQSRLSDDIPRAIRELLPILESYRWHVQGLVNNLKEAATESEEKAENTSVRPTLPALAERGK